MAIHLLLWGNATPANVLLDGAIVVVDELAFRVVVTIPARQVVVVENTAPTVVVNENPLRPEARIGVVASHIVEVTEVLKPVAVILPARIPVARVIENTSGAETR